MQAWCRRKGLNVDSVLFTYKEGKLWPKDTPATYCAAKAGDEIIVHAKIREAAGSNGKPVSPAVKGANKKEIAVEIVGHAGGWKVKCSMLPSLTFAPLMNAWRKQGGLTTARFLLDGKEVKSSDSPGSCGWTPRRGTGSGASSSSLSALIQDAAGVAETGQPADPLDPAAPTKREPRAPSPASSMGSSSSSSSSCSDNEAPAPDGRTSAVQSRKLENPLRNTFKFASASDDVALASLAVAAPASTPTPAVQAARVPRRQAVAPATQQAPPPPDGAAAISDDITLASLGMSVQVKAPEAASGSSDTIKNTEGTKVGRRKEGGAASGPAAAPQAPFGDEDAPEESAAHHRCQYNEASGNIVFMVQAADGGRLTVETPVSAVNGDVEEAQRIARLCYARFEAGASKEDVFQYRTRLYERATVKGKRKVHPPPQPADASSSGEQRASKLLKREQLEATAQVPAPEVVLAAQPHTGAASRAETAVAVALALAADEEEERYCAELEASNGMLRAEIARLQAVVENAELKAEIERLRLQAAQ
eukprot:TRINITY_DN6096_c0_g1_i2.p1 TRINITY_DN6096_c0_g1~~TRINITY_DN6096_c0_g1_i2.p1  ORF type:complete len:610 (+),score=124.93 TRINITY_DN6096_c0_g1_i2:228-1832(+)